MKNELQELMENDDEDIKEIAIMINNLISDLDAREISKSEFNELANDLLDLERIDELADTVERKAAFAEAFSTLKTVIKAVPFI